MATNYHVLEFPLKEEMTSEKFQSIDFLPYGTRTLKIKVTNPDKVPDVLVLRSKKVPQEGFGDKYFYSHEQDGTNFRLSWGGGRGKGACLLGKDKKVIGKEVPIQECLKLDQPVSYVYLNLTHVDGPVNRSYTLVLTAHLEKDPISASAPYKLELILTPPQQVRDQQVQVKDLVRLVPENDKGTIYTFQGTYVPAYLNRWWSPKEISYPVDVPPLPDLRLRMEKNLLKIDMVTNTSSQGARQYKLIAQVQDNIMFQGVIDEARYFDAELYHFTKHFFVLRLWFSWLEKHGHNTALDEIPDAERFDFVIDSEKHQVVYAATDFHWREAWAPAPRNPRLHVKAHIGLFSDHGLSFLKKKIPFIQSWYDGWLSWIEEFIKQDVETKVRIPSDYVRQVVEEPDKAVDLGANIDAHVPYFENCPKPEGVHFISSNPTQG